MGTPFYQPDNGSGNQGANPHPQAGNTSHQQWAQSPASQPFYGAQPPAPTPPGQAQWGGAPGSQTYNVQNNYHIQHNTHVPQHHATATPQFQQYQPQPQQKSMILAALLALFLGTLGVHNFYLGYTRAGLMQVGLTVAGWVLSIVLIGLLFLFVVGAWALIDFLLILLRSGRFKFDSRGVPLL